MNCCNVRLIILQKYLDNKRFLLRCISSHADTVFVIKQNSHTLPIKGHKNEVILMSVLPDRNF